MACFKSFKLKFSRERHIALRMSFLRENKRFDFSINAASREMKNLLLKKYSAGIT